MGLDIVELVMAIEENFDVEVNAADWSGDVKTVGDVVNLIQYGKELKSGAEDGRIEKCNALLLAALKDISDIEELPPGDQPLDVLFPKKDRRRNWCMLEQALKRHDKNWFLFDLEHPSWVIGFGCLGVVILPVVALWGQHFWPLLAIPVYAIMAYGLKTRLPSCLSTVDELVLWMPIPTPKVEADDGQVVFERLKEIMVEMFGISPDSVTWNAKLYDDLGLE